MPLLASIDGGPALWSLAECLNQSDAGDGTLLGYSMGGRIALHMLIRSQQWKRAVIVSASPGLTETEDRGARLANDLRWADRFKTENWDETITAWNSQGVFANDPGQPDRRESDYRRSDLAAALVLGSVAGQENLRPHLRNLEIPILWIAGERDAKYAALAQECASVNPMFTCKIILGAGHRVPWAYPDEFCEAVEQFLTPQQP
jgi:2-succinyl-6-hydroxy-2,4-cyclohexadiene-1-carboxylate synthase